MQDHTALRLALRLNAGFSTLSALAIFFTHANLAEWMGIASPILLATALGLALFAGHLVFTAGRSDIAKLRAESVRHSIADFGWVVGSVALMAMDVLTATGNWIVALVALPVLALGVAQWRFLPAPDSHSIAVEF